MKILLLFTFLFITITLSAQSNISIEWGEEVKFKRTASNIIIGHNDTSYYTAGLRTLNLGFADKRVSNDILIKKYDIETAQLLKEIEIESFKYNKKEAYFEEVFFSNENVYLIYSVYNSKKDIRSLIVKKTDINGTVNKPILLAEINETDKDDEGFTIKHSPDSNNFLIVYDLFGTKTENSEKTSIIKVFDKSFTELWTKEIELSYNKESYEFTHYNITNDGNVYLFGNDNLNFDVRNPKTPNREYVLFNVNKNKTKRFTLPTESKYADGVSMGIIENNIIISGMYSFHKYTNELGFFYYKINPESFEVVQQDFSPVSKKFVTDFLDNAEFKSDKTFGNFIFKDITESPNGETVIIGQLEYVVYGKGFYDRVYNDILVLKISKAGTLSLLEHIPKKQFGMKKPLFCSYKILNYNNKMHIIFNDTEAVEDRNSGNKKINKKGMRYRFVNSFTIDSLGNTNYEMLLNNEKNGQVISAARIYRISDSKYVIYTAGPFKLFKPKTYCAYGILSFEQ